MDCYIPRVAYIDAVVGMAYLIAPPNGGGSAATLDKYIDLRKLSVVEYRPEGTLFIGYDRAMLNGRVVTYPPGKYMKFLNSVTIGVEDQISELGYVPDWDYNEPLIRQVAVEVYSDRVVLHIQIFNGGGFEMDVIYSGKKLVERLPSMSTWAATLVVPTYVPEEVVKKPPRKIPTWAVALGIIAFAGAVYAVYRARRGRR